MSVSASVANTQAQSEVLAGIEPDVAQLMQRHIEARRLWFPNDFLSADEVIDDEQLRELNAIPERAKGIPDAVRVALALNLLTEEGLPHFHRLVAVYLGEDNAWQQWNYLWTAEEDRHGCALHDYVRTARIFDMGAFEKLQFKYVEAGFNPAWHGDPYRLLAYTSLQERATQAAHANTARAAGKYEPLIQRILAHISADESRHFRFYRDVFGILLQRDTSRALQSALTVVPNLAMPGHTIDGYMEMADVVRRAGIYGPRDYLRLVIEVLDHWDVANLEPEDAEGRAAQDKLMATPKRLERLADLLDKRNKPKSFNFDFTYRRTLELD